MNEHNTTNQLLLDIGSEIRSVRLFRNNTGQGWIGDVTRIDARRILISNPRPLHAGLCVGSSDLIGWKTVEITPDMVGRKVAIFTGLEVKAPKGRASSEQLNFVARVCQAGGIAGVVRNIEDVKKLLSEVKL